MIRLNAEESPDKATPVVQRTPAARRAVGVPLPADSPAGGNLAKRAGAADSPRLHRERTTVHRIAMRMFWPITAAICAALAVVATGQLRYRAAARFQVHGPMDIARGELLDFLWLRATQDELADWNVRCVPENATIEADITVADPDRANLVIRSLADGFKKQIARRATRQSRRPDDAQRLLAEIIDEWRTRVATLHADMDKLKPPASTNAPANDATVGQARIAELTDAYEVERGLEIDALARIDRLVTTPTDPRVDPETRRLRYQSRAGLQEDTDELTLQLKIGRRHLDDVWQRASPALDALISAIARLVREGTTEAAREADATRRTLVADLTRPAELYQKRLNAFSKHWIQTFVRMRTQPADPHAPRLFGVQDRLHALLADFSFHAGKLVDTMRTELQSLTEQTNDAGHQALVSQMRRAFHRFEADHRQFELLAADVYRRNNFRLDAAIKSARGLRRRVRITVETIDAELLAEAKMRAARVRRMEQRDADRQLRKTRQHARDTIDALLVALSARDGALRQADIRTRQAWEFDRASERYADANEQLQRREALLGDHLRAARAGMTPPVSVEIIKCSADETPQGLARKLSFALAAGVLAFTAVTFVNRR